MIDSAFGARIRQERERRGIAIASVADRTKIAPTLLVALERGDVTRWPGGIYRRAFIRAYAEAVGLNPNDLAREFFECFPVPIEAVPGDAQGGPIALGASVVPKPVPPGAHARVLVRIDRPPHLCRGGTLLADMRQRVGALAVDLAIVLLTATGCSVAIGDFWMPFAIAMVCYYAGGILIFGNTAGVCLFAAVSGEDPAHAAAHAPHASASAPSAM